MNAFSYALSILKTLVSVCAGALAAGEQLGVLPNVPFNECAHWFMVERVDGDGNRMEPSDAGYTNAVPEHIAGLDALVDKAAGEGEALPKLLMLVGLPGAGKSHHVYTCTYM